MDTKQILTLSLDELVAAERRLAKIEYLPGIDKIIDYTSMAIFRLRLEIGRL